MLPKDLGATAAGRNTAFAREGRNPNAVRQAAERQVRNGVAPIKRHLKKGRKKEAAAMLGGLARDPAVRPLLEASDTVLINRAAAILGEAGAGVGVQTYDDARAVEFAAKLFAPDDSPRKRQGGRLSRNPQPAPTSE